MSTSPQRSTALGEALCRIVRNTPGLTLPALRAHPALAGLATATVDQALDVAVAGTPSGWRLVEDATGTLLAVRERAA